VSAHDEWGHVAIPEGRWFADRFDDYVGANPLSEQARTVRGLALSFPRFQAPTGEQLLQLQRDMVLRSGSARRPFGAVALKTALRELKEKGFYGVRKVSFGKASPGSTKIPMACARSFSNKPVDHKLLLDGLTADAVLLHDQASARHWRHYERTGQLPVRPNNVFDLNARRQARKSA
jgi:hypothetical protein